MNENHDILDGKPFKVIVFGEAGVGKSALSIRYVCQEFSDAYDPTIEDNYEIDIEVDGCPIKVEVVDTAGNDVFRRMRDQYIKSGDGFLLVYSITDRSSSTAITSFHEQIVAAKGKKDKIIPQIPIILVGNKSDLDDEREVSYQDGKKIAATLCCSFFETSAKNDIGVDEVFANLAKKMRESRANSVRKAFIRDRHRFSLRNLSLKEKKCKEKLQAFRAGETKSKLSKRSNGRFRGLICGARSLDTIDG
ncbi:hypothetical protein pdam_00000018 [Pocillopora damicornis]|uniref:Small monomeric GTPase n=1 Tax=Pocillopora damicornis TaxID=46731 RepID=A0A3M6UX67_POCDA|nr:ras-related protein Rap-2b-like [Pocillopora damicornis]RMX58124.1 hypothetical protein pdam_00000018 [Pocillopora damicornis]